MSSNRSVRYIKYGAEVIGYVEPQFVVHNRTQSGAGVDWDISTQKIILSNSNPTSKDFYIRFTNQQALAAGSPNWGSGINPNSLLIPYLGIPVERCYAYVQTLVYYLKTQWTGGTPNFNWTISATVAPGLWNGTPTYINPVTYTYNNTTNYSGNDNRGEKIVPGRGTYNKLGDDYKIPATLPGVSNPQTWEDGYGFNDFDPEYNYIKISVTTSKPNNATYSGELYVDGTFEYDHLQRARTTVLHWQGEDIIIDGVDGDAIGTILVSSSLTTIANQKWYLDNELYNTTFTLNEQSANLKFCPPLAISTQSSLSVVVDFKLGFTKTFEIETVLDATTENFVRIDPLELSTSTTLSATATFKPTAIVNATAAFTSTQSAGLIYDINADYSWNTFNLNIYFESGFVEEGFVSAEGEYNWNFLETAAWDDWPTITWIGNEATWDNWPDDVWEKTYTLGWRGVLSVTPSFKLGDTVSYTGAFTFAEDSAFLIVGEPDDIESSFTVDATAAGRIDGNIEMTGAFAPDLTANIKYSLNDTPITITGAFTPVLTANARTDTFADIDVAFIFAVEPTFKPSGQSQFEVEINSDFVGNEIYGPSLELSVLASELTTARLFYQADPWNIYKVQQEIRTVVVPAENRQTIILEENRLNMISAETRGYIVPQETRSLKLMRPPFSNIYSTPRVRSEQ